MNESGEQPRFGPHTAAVEEVIAFVESGGVLARPFDPPSGEAERFLIIRSLDDLDYFQEPNFDGTRIIGNLNWIDIKRLDGRRFPLDDVPNNDEIIQLRERLWPTYEVIDHQLWVTLRDQLDGIVSEVDTNDIHDDLSNLVFIRSLRGILAGAFKERLFSIYRAGGYPCGWEGRFPKGRLVVFSR